MRVAVFAPDYDPKIGGGYTFLTDVIDGFLEVAGDSPHEFILLLAGSSLEEVRARKSVPKNVRLVRMPKRSFGGRLVAALRHISPTVALIWRARSSLERMCHKFGVEMIWFVGGLYDTPNVPFFTTVWDVQHRTHPYYPEVSSDGIWDYREAFLQRHLKRAACIITGTEVGVQELGKFYGIPDDNVLIAPHPTPRFALTAAAKDPQPFPDHLAVERDFLIYPAQFWPHKNHATLILALANLRQRGFTVPQLVLVGSDKGNKDFIERLALEAGVLDRVCFAGFVSIKDLVSLYQHATAMVYPSASGPENLPPLEAFALRCPVIASDFEGSREQLGQAAHFFKPMDAAALSDAIIKIQDRGYRDQLVELGRQRAISWKPDDFVTRVLERIEGFSVIRSTWGATRDEHRQ